MKKDENNEPEITLAPAEPGSIRYYFVRIVNFSAAFALFALSIHFGVLFWGWVAGLFG